MSDVSGDALPRTDDASVIRLMSKVSTDSALSRQRFVVIKFKYSPAFMSAVG
jgi:hypothetical protein